MFKQPLLFDNIGEPIDNHSLSIEQEISLIWLNIREEPDLALGVGQEMSTELRWLRHQHTILINSLVNVDYPILLMHLWVEVRVMASKVDVPDIPVEILSDIGELFGLHHFQSVVQREEEVVTCFVNVVHEDPVVIKLAFAKLNVLKHEVSAVFSTISPVFLKVCDHGVWHFDGIF